jgi:hypothetical protein
MTRIAARFADSFSYAAAGATFFFLRMPLLPLWWMDHNADFALVGLMAKHTKAGHFPIFFYGQNYMGGLEWLTAAFFSLLRDPGTGVSLLVLRWNSLLWWFAAGAIWVVALRLKSRLSSHVFAWLFALASLPLLQVSVLQELSPEYVFFGGLLLYLLLRIRNLAGKEGFVFGFFLGLAWWTNQGVVFFVLPALLLFQALPARWDRAPLVKELLVFPKRSRPLRLLLGFLMAAGVLVGVFGGLRLAWLKIPNGLSMSRDAFLLFLVLQAWRAGRRLWRAGRLAEALRPLVPVLGGFLEGYAPVWLGRIFGWYEKSYGIGLGILPWWQWRWQLEALGRSLWQMLFSQSILVALACFLVIVVAVISRTRTRSRRIVLYCVLVALLNLGYVFFSDRAGGAPLRYLYPTAVAFAVLLAELVAGMRSVLLKSAAFALLFLCCGYTALASRNLLVARAWQREHWKRNVESLLQTMEANGIHYCWGDYWTSYLITGLSDEQIIVSPHPSAPASQVRVKSYAREVAARNPSCFLYRDGTSVTAEIHLTDRNPWGKK